jgi:hypothetical protein
MEHQPPGHFEDSRTMSFAVARFVQEGEVPSGREIGVDYLTHPEIRVTELAACQIAAIISGIGAVRSRVRQNRVRGWIFKGKERIRKMVKGVRDAGGACARDEDNVAAVVG